MSINLTQRFVSGLPVFDTYYGMSGNIVAMFLDSVAVPPLAPLFTGAYFLVEFQDSTRQTFTSAGKWIDHVTGVTFPGVTLLTSTEYTALVGVGYPTVV